jgi:hypothetical protein
MANISSADNRTTVPNDQRSMLYEWRMNNDPEFRAYENLRKEDPPLEDRSLDMVGLARMFAPAESLGIFLQKGKALDRAIRNEVGKRAAQGVAIDQVSDYAADTVQEWNRAGDPYQNNLKG